jgi:hypothetical protein
VDLVAEATDRGLTWKVGVDVKLPEWLRLWLNDNLPFGGMRKTLRRLWVADEAYAGFERQMLALWRDG